MRPLLLVINKSKVLMEDAQRQPHPQQASASLWLDSVLSSEHIIDLGQIIGTRSNVIRASQWSKVLLEMSFLT